MLLPTTSLNITKKTARKLIDDGRANFMTAADYRPGSDMEKLMMQIIDHMQADARLEELEGQYQ